MVAFEILPLEQPLRAAVEIHTIVGNLVLRGTSEAEGTLLN